MMGVLPLNLPQVPEFARKSHQNGKHLSNHDTQQPDPSYCDGFAEAPMTDDAGKRFLSVVDFKQLTN